MSGELIPIGEPCALTKRCISEETCAKWKYHYSQYEGKDVQVANYCNAQGQVIAQKIRFPDKNFKFLGNTKEAGLYGQHLWGDKGKAVIITEGEIDALTVGELQKNKWPVVSIPNGAAGARKAIEKAIQWLEGFESVVFMFDMDEPGIEAAKECALLLSPGKAKIAKLPLKDPNEMLQAGRADEVIKAFWDAKVYRPDGIVAGTELWDIISKEDNVKSIPYPWAELNSKTRGLRAAELVTFTAGSGTGKSQAIRELAHSLLSRGETLGYIALEESTKRTALGMVGIELNRPIHLSREGVSEEEFRAAFDRTVGSGRCFLYDHFGSVDSDNLLNRIRYMARGCGCGWVILDHLSIVVSGSEDDDERRLIDRLMTSLRSLVQETGIGMILVSHLKRPEGKGHEEGAQTSLGQLRGSAAIGQLSDVVIGLERNQQSLKGKNITKIRILKNRWVGDTGLAGRLKYDPETGRLTETTEKVEEDDATSDF